MAIDFKSLLSRPLDEVKRPPPMPAGLYYGIISGFKFQESPWENKETGEPDAQVQYIINRLEADATIAPELLAEIDLSKRQMRADLPLSGGNEYITKSFLEACGIAVAGRGFGEACPEAVGQSVMFDVTHRLNKQDPTQPPFADVRNLRKRPD